MSGVVIVYFKKKLKSVTVVYEDGETETFQGASMRLQCSENWRDKSGWPRWNEFYVSWFEMIEHKQARPVEDIELPEPKGLNADELRKDPSFVGIIDNKAYFKKENELWKEFDSI